AVTGQQSTTTVARSYPLPGGVTAVRDASGLSDAGSDLLGTPIATFTLDTGTATGRQLPAPYGQARFAATGATAGRMHTQFGFTGQREDVQEQPAYTRTAGYHADNHQHSSSQRFRVQHLQFGGVVGARHGITSSS